jgi:4-alpha-glucanotransferase
MDLFTQAAELGIQTGFFDGQGHWHTTDANALKLILEALPVRSVHGFLDGPVIIRAGRLTRAELCENASLPLRWTISDGARIVAEGVAHDRAIEWPQNISSGAYTLSFGDSSEGEQAVPFIVAPDAYSGEFDRLWVLAVQLYGVRSDRNWGIGDFTDLEALIHLSADLGASGVGLNPLHALFDDRPDDCSPYAPNSRVFLNPLYIDVERIPGFTEELDLSALAELRAQELVDYPGGAALKMRALRAGYERFVSEPDAPEQASFAAFRAARAPVLRRFACFEVLRHSLEGPWWEWPAAWQHPDDAVCAAMFAGPDRHEIGFIEYAQWCAEEQLQACQRVAASRGMAVGLYLDVAVGVQGGGFDAWNEQVAISRFLSVGAPPDSLNTAGQNWGLAGFNAAGLEARAYAPFRDMLRASMRHAGAIRLDHVLGLNRLYLVPHGYTAADGVYVKMPLEALLAVTAQESRDNRCVVIGEDLGTVPDGFRERLADFGIWSYLVMMFERDGDGSFRDSARYKQNALVTFNTHDLPTFTGWSSFGDLVSKRAIGLDPGESDDGRRYAIAQLRDALAREGIEHADFIGVAAYLSRTPSRLLAIEVEDLLGVAEQPNIPGTTVENPNWRRRLPVPVERLRQAIDVDGLVQATASRRPAGV